MSKRAHDIVFGTNDDAYADMLVGWGGSDWLQGYGGENLLIGGAGDKFVVDNGAGHCYHGTYKSVDLDNPFETMLFTLILDLIQTKLEKKLLLMKMVSSKLHLLSMILVVVRPLILNFMILKKLTSMRMAISIKTLTDGNVYVDSAIYNKMLSWLLIRRAGVAQIEVTNDKGKKVLTPLRVLRLRLTSLSLRMV